MTNQPDPYAMTPEEYMDVFNATFEAGKKAGMPKALLDRIIQLEAENRRLREVVERASHMFGYSDVSKLFRHSYRLGDIAEMLNNAIAQPTPTTGLLELARAGIRVDKIEQKWQSTDSPGSWTTELAEECKAAHAELHSCRTALPPEVKEALEGMG